MESTPAMLGNLIDARNIANIVLEGETDGELEDRMMREKGQLVVEALWRQCTNKEEGGSLRSEIKQLQIADGPVVDTQLLLRPKAGEDQGLYICISPLMSEDDDKASNKPEEMIKIIAEGYIMTAGPEEEDDDEELSPAAIDQLFDGFYEELPYMNDEVFSSDVLIKHVVALYTTPEEYAHFATEYDGREAQRAALYDDEF